MMKLYVVYNALETIDKLLISLSTDVLEALNCSCGQVTNAHPSLARFLLAALRLLMDSSLCVFVVCLHSLVLLTEEVRICFVSSRCRYS